MADAGALQVALSPEIKTAFDGYQRTVEAFKTSNDERLKGIEERFADVVKAEETKKINDALDALKEDINKQFVELKRAGANNNGNEAKEKSFAMYDAEIAALDTYVRKGFNAGIAAVNALGQKAKELGFEQKDLSTVVLADGGVAVRPEWEAEMIEVVEEISDLRPICGIMESGTGEKKVLVDKGGAQAAWAGELEDRIRTAHAQLAERTFVADELYALNFITETMKEDAVFDVMAWVMENATEAIARTEGAAFINGDGAKKPKGILRQTIVADASWAWDKLGYIATGKSAAFDESFPGNSTGPVSAANGADVLFRAIHALPKKYRVNGDWVMNRLTLAEVRMLKDGNGQYMFKDALTTSGFLSQLLGYPITEAEDMPDIAADTYSIAFGDFRRGYKILDRSGISLKRDDITAPQFDKIYIRRRVGGDVGDFQAIKLIKFGTS